MDILILITRASVLLKLSGIDNDNYLRHIFTEKRRKFDLLNVSFTSRERVNWRNLQHHSLGSGVKQGGGHWGEYVECVCGEVGSSVCREEGTGDCIKVTAGG